MACMFMNAALLVNYEIICEIVEEDGCSPLWGWEWQLPPISYEWQPWDLRE